MTAVILKRNGVSYPQRLPKSLYIAGFDGYNEESDSFYDNALDTGIDKAEKIEHTKDNLSMLKDIGESNNDFKIQFITPSVYEKVFK